MHRLVLMRHAKAGGGSPDLLRPLTERGRRQAAYQAGAVARSAGRVDLAVVSDATRALHTLQGLQSAGLEIGSVRREHEVYTAGWRGLLDLVAQFEENIGTALVIGHNPAISAVCLELVTEDSPFASQLRAGFSTAMAVVGTLESWPHLGRRGLDVEAVLRAPC